MKLLLDCILTSSRPRKCSSTIQFITFVNRTLAARDDVFFYWLIPNWLDEELVKEDYPQHERIRYIRVPQHRDRTKEYFTVSRELEYAAAFNGPTWDYDMLVTTRTGAAAVLRLIMNSPRQPKLTWLRRLIVIEEMPLMDFKKTVSTINADVQDLYTMSGYLAADRVCILSYHEKGFIMRRARDFFAPSVVRRMDGLIHPVITSQFSDYRLKQPDEYPEAQGRPFCVAHSGRMEMANRIEEINKVMVSHYALKGTAVRLLVTTVSDVIKEFDQSVVEVQQATREEFWELCKKDMDVFLKLSTEGGFSLALLEPMMFGVPAIIMREPWSEALFGKDYPFFVNNEVEAYAYVGMFYEDYPTMYAKWSDWHNDVFRPLMNARFQTDLLYDYLDAELDVVAGHVTRYREAYPGKCENGFVADLLGEVGDSDEFRFKDVIERLHEKGKVNVHIRNKIQDDARDGYNLVYSTAWHEYRAMFLAFHGWEDASTDVGHLRRVKEDQA